MKPSRLALVLLATAAGACTQSSSSSSSSSSSGNTSSSSSSSGTVSSGNGPSSGQGSSSIAPTSQVSTSSAATSSGGNTSSGGIVSSGGTASSGGAGSSSGFVCSGTDATIQDIASGTVGLTINVKLTGVIAMSQKFLISKSSATNSCLWGVFVSAPGLVETGPNTGILVTDYGTPASVPDGGTSAFCPRLGLDPTGGFIPDDVKPGDVLDIIGRTDQFLQNACSTTAGGSTVGQKQINRTCSVTRTGTTTPPAPHLLTGPDVALLASPSDATFHGQWGGVKVSVQNVTAPVADGGVSVVDQYGVIHLAEGSLNVGDKIYYRGYLRTQDPCHAGPTYDGATTFTSVAGFSYLDFCTWTLQPNEKCTDIAPPSADCAGLTCAQ